MPLYRSLLMWLGLLGLLFLLWSWNRSLTRLSVAEGTIAGRDYAIAVANGSLVIIRGTAVSGPTIYGAFKFDDQPLDAFTKAAVPAPAMIADASLTLPGSEGMIISLWIPAAISLAAWPGLLYWRHRGMRGHEPKFLKAGQAT